MRAAEFGSPAFPAGDAPAVTDHPLETSALVIDLAPGQIEVPRGRERQFDATDERDRMFLDSIRRVGVLHPPEVRRVGERYELVFGRRSLLFFRLRAVVFRVPIDAGRLERISHAIVKAPDKATRVNLIADPGLAVRVRQAAAPSLREPSHLL